MDDRKLLAINSFIRSAYECFSFEDFLKLSILNLHEFVMYDSAMFYCGISRDCSFFKPYVRGRLEDYYQKSTFAQRDEYRRGRGQTGAGAEALVYRAQELQRGQICVGEEPRESFLLSQEEFRVACVRIVYHGEFLGEIYLHRGADKPDFDDEDMFVLRLLQPHISTVFNIIHTVKAIEFVETENAKLGQSGLCTLDGELSITGGNVTGLDMLKTPTVYGSSVLYHVKELCEDMLGEVRPGETLCRTETFRTAGGGIRTQLLLCPDVCAPGQRQFFLLLRPEAGEAPESAYKLKFTKREADIIDGIIQGKNNPQLAAALGLSENTVKTHIQNIYRKAGANNRTELACLLLRNGK